MNPLTREVYEIKTVRGEAAGQAQLANYLIELNKATPNAIAFPWTPGSSYVPPEKLINVYKQIDATVYPPRGGVVTYELDESQERAPELAFVVAAATAALLLGIGLTIAAGGPSRAFI